MIFISKYFIRLLSIFLHNWIFKEVTKNKIKNPAEALHLVGYVWQRVRSSSLVKVKFDECVRATQVLALMVTTIREEDISNTIHQLWSFWIFWWYFHPLEIDDEFPAKLGYICKHCLFTNIFLEKQNSCPFVRSRINSYIFSIFFFLSHMLSVLIKYSPNQFH